MDKAREKVYSVLGKIFEIQTKWQDINTKGVDIATVIVNNVIRFQYLQKNNWGVFADDELLQQKVNAKLKRETDCKYSELQSTFDQLVSLLHQLEDHSDTIDKLQQKLTSDHGSSIMDVPIGVTWGINNFVDYCATLVLSYKKDIQIKEAILKDILINQSRDIQTIYIASWQMQVYIQKCTPLKSILSSEFPD